MAVDERSIAPRLPQDVPATDVPEILKLVRESLRPLALRAGPLVTAAFAYRSQTQTGTVRKDFLEGLVIALLSFAIGLAVGAALCMSRR
jgi:hypothetical protein